MIDHSQQNPTLDIKTLEELCETCRAAQEAQPDAEIQKMMRSVCECCRSVKAGLHDVSDAVKQQQYSHESREQLILKAV